MKKKALIITIAILTITVIGIVIFLSFGKGNKFTISFDTNGGKSLSSIKVNNGDTSDLPKPEKEGYDFVGWYTEDGKAFDFNTRITSDIKLIAKWQKKNTRINVIFYGNGGNIVSMDGGGTILYDMADENGKVSKPMPDPERNGYTFIGWYTEDGKAFDFNTRITSDIKLIAKWQKK